MLLGMKVIVPYSPFARIIVKHTNATPSAQAFSFQRVAGAVASGWSTAGIGTTLIHRTHDREARSLPEDLLHGGGHYS